MSLPDSIEILPLQKPVRTEITVPGSKSITNRALILAALAQGEVTLQGALWSEDTQIMVECLQELGFMVNIQLDPSESCNRTITVYGKGGAVPPGGTPDQPMELFVGNAGTAARFLAAFLCLGRGVYRLHGVPRMHERPQAALFQALRELGYQIQSENGNDKLPARIFGAGPRPGRCSISIRDSSQFASALLLCRSVAGWEIDLRDHNEDEMPYVEMTRLLAAAFPSRAGGTFTVEPDGSSASYFWGAMFLLEHFENTRGSSVTVVKNPVSDLQIDSKFAARFPLNPLSRSRDLGDSIMTAIAIAPLMSSIRAFTDLGRLRLQECERVAALRTELTKCGATVLEQGDTLVVHPGVLHGAEIETYNDHRMAMCFAILGLKVPGIKINNPACVKKTFPNFFQKLAAPPPRGLGVTILDGRTRRPLTEAELFAD